MDMGVLDERKEKTLRRMMEWYSTRPKGEVIKVHIDGKEVASFAPQWVEYMVIQLESRWYSLLAKGILNGLREYWIRYGDNLPAKGRNV